jgi:protein-disulfide isomerase
VQYIFHYYALGEFQILLGEAAHCAADQGGFWEYHMLMFENQRRFGSVNSLEELQDLFGQFAEQVGLDVSAFDTCWSSHQHQESIVESVLSARESGVSGTPAFSIQGELLVGNQPLDVFREAIEKSLAEVEQ